MPESMLPDEKRELKRLALNAPALVESLAKRGEGDVKYLVTRDLSGGGAYFHTRVPLEVETTIEVGIFLDIEKLEEISLDGHVLIQANGMVQRVDSSGMAVRFLGKCRVLPLY